MGLNKTQFSATYIRSQSINYIPPELLDTVRATRDVNHFLQGITAKGLIANGAGNAFRKYPQFSGRLQGLPTKLVCFLQHTKAKLDSTINLILPKLTFVINRTLNN